jgi:hypothetical protein
VWVGPRASWLHPSLLRLLVPYAGADTPRAAGISIRWAPCTVAAQAALIRKCLPRRCRNQPPRPRELAATNRAFESRKNHGEHGPMAVAFEQKLALMFSYHTVGHEQTQTRPVLLGCEVRFKEVVAILI